jgi:hypothetical protein
VHLEFKIMTPLKSPGSSLWNPRGDPYDRAREAEIPLPNTATAKRDALTGQVMLSPEQQKALAAAIVRAAAKARNELVADGSDLPIDPVAKQIIECGRRRRGEQV